MAIFDDLDQNEKILTSDATLDEDYLLDYASLGASDEDDENTLVSAAKGTYILGVSTVNSLMNAGVGVGNFLGGDFEYTDTEDRLGGELGERYLDNSSNYDLGGELISSFVPGAFAVKGAKALARGKTSGIGKFFNDDYYRSAHKAKASKALKEYGERDSWNKREFIQDTLALGATRGAVEGATFELGAYVGINLFSDMDKEELDGIDVGIKLLEHVTTGAAFGAVFNGLGSFALRTNQLHKAIKRSDVGEERGKDLFQSTPVGSRIAEESKFTVRQADETVSRRALQERIAPTEQRIVSLVDDLVVQNKADVPLVGTMRSFVQRNTPEVVSNLLTGAKSVTRVFDRALKEAESFPPYVSRYIEDAGILGGELHPVVALKGQFATFPENLPRNVRTWMEKETKNGRIDEVYYQDEAYGNLADGTISLELTDPYLADKGIKAINSKGDKAKDWQVSLQNGQNLRMNDSREAARIIAKDRILDSKDFKPIQNFSPRLETFADYVQAEALYVLKKSSNDREIVEAPFPKGTFNLDGLRDKIVDYKSKLLDDYVSEGASHHKIKQDLGVDVEEIFENGGANPEDWITLGKESLTEPRHVRLTYERTTFSLRRQEAYMMDRRAWQQTKDFAELEAGKVLGRHKQHMPSFVRSILDSANTIGAGLFRSATAKGEFLGGEATASAIGGIAHNVTKSKADETFRTLETVFSGMSAYPDDVVEMAAIRTFYDGLDGAAELIVDGESTYIAKKGVDLDSDRVREFVDYFEVSSKRVDDWLQTWHKNHTPIAQEKLMMMKAEGMHPKFDPEDFYLPPQPIKFASFAYMPDGLGGNTKVGVIRGNTAEELDAAVERVLRANPQLKVRSIKDINDYYKGLGQFDVSKKFSREIDQESFPKLGQANDLQPNVDAEALVADLQQYVYSAHQKNTRRATKLMYSKEFSVLEDLHERQVNALSKGEETSLDRFQIANTPAGDAIKTMLDIAPNQSWELLNAANKSFDKYVSRAYNGIKKRILEGSGKRAKQLLGSDTKLGLDKINAEFAPLGINFEDANAVIAAANPDINKRHLQAFLSRMNGWQATLMLRADGLDGLVNNMSAAIITAPEVRGLLKQVQGENSGDLRKLLTLRNGDGVEEISIINSWLRGTRRIGNPEEYAAFKQKWRDRGLYTPADEAFEQIGNVIDETFQGGLKGVKGASKKLDSLWRKVGSKTFIPSDTLNDFAQLQVLSLVDDIADVLKLGEGQRITLAHQLKGRVLGMNIPSQKPTLFHGAIGTPIGLYQNYNLNVINAMLRYAGEKGQAARFVGMQGSLFGLQGLPGFEQLNTAVHDLYGKEDGKDLKAILDGTLGTDALKWAVYGSGSVAIDGAIYTRGDLNQRNRLIIPTALNEIPAFNFVSAIMGGVSKTATDVVNGADFGPSFLDNLAHTGINRPLTGIIDAYRGYSTTKKGGLAGVVEGSEEGIASAEFWKANATRLLGARPFDEALLRERNYRLGRSVTNDQREIDEIGQSLKKDLISKGGEVSQVDIDRFLTRFIQLGKTPDQFEKWLRRQEKEAGKDAYEKLEKRIKNSRYYETYLQYLQ